MLVVCFPGMGYVALANISERRSTNIGLANISEQRSKEPRPFGAGPPRTPIRPAPRRTVACWMSTWMRSRRAPSDLVGSRKVLGLWSKAHPESPEKASMRPGCGITRGLFNHFCDTRESPPFFWGVGLWEALFVVSRQWIPFPTHPVRGVLSFSFCFNLFLSPVFSFWSG